jgi:hypothetical protein
MIAVVASAPERPVVAEFFELFKTPWEFYEPGRHYEVVLCAGRSQLKECSAKLILRYSGQVTADDARENARLLPRNNQARILSYQGQRIPIYGDCVVFPQVANGILIDQQEQQPAARETTVGDGKRVRIGYDLFGEIRTLLTTGQPPSHAGIPTLELHIALLRDLILASGTPLVEIPPVPHGYPLIACLTHDVDHPSIRLHKFDHTIWGFLYRATLGSLANVVRGRATLLDALRNWTAALKLPLVYLGLASDFWLRFTDYPKVEKGLPSSFYVIPFKGRPGQGQAGSAPRHRAAAYGAGDIVPQIRSLMAAGCEIALHGIDAWCDSSGAREELDEIRGITGKQEVGVRMHWLYFGEHSPLNLENAGATYDSTVGYNETVGFRAGTTQAFKPLETTRLLELPLHIMDTALFSPGRLNLSPGKAKKLVNQVVEQANQIGGNITINWHDRSIAPERQWNRVYRELVDDLNRKGAWFATAMQAVSWFRKRRSAVFHNASWEEGGVKVKVEMDGNDDLPPLQLCIRKPRCPGQPAAAGTAAREGDINLKLSGSIDTFIPLSPYPAESPSRKTAPDGMVTTYVI